MQSAIVAENLTLAYPRHEPTIRNASFKVDRKDFVFITGPSGSGKSTLLKSMYGSMKVGGGELWVGGMNLSGISGKNLYKLRRHVGIVFQDYKLIQEWSVERNVMLPLIISGFPKDVCRAQAAKLLGHVKMAHKAEKFPPELSGGEQQRVALARALAHNPFLILADEPTGNLDDYSAKMVWDLLIRAHKDLDTTVVVVTHRIPNLDIDHIRHFMLEDGAVHEIH